ncbi:MAG: glycerol-3-phosphate 1-O-acyltransferase PlsY [Candidatus Omnitrophica bacterium]|nr:glycerol-3-phosphate 1-O-acyltransferase PlsY [Candidatus Omnitrophota bacterium]MDD5437137.1 glycerol-3-phosphate 1-O-acyltransferase PlsY [Candidatus Omnitrophota bacterium]
MTGAIVFILSSLLGYLIGSFPTSFLLAKTLKGVDIRQVGSGNAGATNVLRSVGKLPAVITLIVDVCKGALVVTVVANIFYPYIEDLDYDFYRSFLGLAAVCGHIWPVWLKFRGGKGVATTLGVAIGLAPLVLIPSIVIWLIIFFTTNYVSLASILALIAFPIIAIAFSQPIYLVLISIIICSISIAKHRENIKRLLKGQENKTIIFKAK